MRTSIITVSTLLILVVGCGPTPQVVEFKAKVKTYTEESRAFAKLLETGPSRAQVNASADKLMDLYTHIPRAPGELKSAAEISRNVEELKSQVSSCPELIRRWFEFSGYTLDSGKAFKKINERYEQRIVDIRKTCDDIEAALAK